MQGSMPVSPQKGATRVHISCLPRAVLSGTAFLEIHQAVLYHQLQIWLQLTVQFAHFPLGNGWRSRLAVHSFTITC